jgi:hypothetical protein
VLTRPRAGGRPSIRAKVVSSYESPMPPTSFRSESIACLLSSKSPWEGECMIETSGEMVKDGISGPVYCRMQAFDYGDGRIRWAGWVNPAEGHPHWHPIVLCDGPYTLITNEGLQLEVILYTENGFFKGFQRGNRPV